MINIGATIVASTTTLKRGVASLLLSRVSTYHPYSTHNNNTVYPSSYSPKQFNNKQSLNTHNDSLITSTTCSPIVHYLKRGYAELTAPSTTTAALEPKINYHLYNQHPKPPHLPLPDLDTTCKKFLDSILPLLEPSEQAEYKAIVESFQKGEGKKLQEELIKYNNERPNSSYVAEFWDDMYLEGRWPLPVNVSPFLQFLPAPPGRSAPYDRAATIVGAMLDYAINLRSGKLPTEWRIPEKHSNDMYQFYRIFGTTRIARPGRDISVTFDESQSNHLVVLRNNRFYSIPVLEKDTHGVWRRISNDTLAATFNKILLESKEGIPVGVLTTDDRDIWGTTRKTLELSGVNKATLQQIDSALFLLCFDSEAPTNKEEISARLLHGNPGNRWFDKNFSVIVFSNGVAGANFEHSWGDGVTWVSFITSLKYSDQPISLNSTPAEITELQWDLRTPHMLNIEESTATVSNLIDSVDTVVFEHNVGKDTIKRLGYSPDAFVQMAFQIAFYTLHHKIPPTYESASTRHFLRGRTETIRTVSYESVELVKTLDNLGYKFGKPIEGFASGSALRPLLKKAIKKHSEISAAALEGRGTDRHLFALLNIAKRLHKLSGSTTGFVPPQIFSHPAYSKYHNILVSTSNLSTPKLTLFGFGATSLEGYGIGYNILSEKVVANITSFKNQGTDSKKFGEALRWSLDLLRALH